MTHFGAYFSPRSALRVPVSAEEGKEVVRPGPALRAGGSGAVRGCPHGGHIGVLRERSWMAGDSRAWDSGHCSSGQPATSDFYSNAPGFACCAKASRASVSPAAVFKIKQTLEVKNPQVQRSLPSVLLSLDSVQKLDNFISCR